MDVNDYLEYLIKNQMYDGSHIFGYGYATVIYVDPYNLGTVQIPKLKKLLSQHYCELIFNFFISDFRRNIAKDDGRLQSCLGGTSITTENELMEWSARRLCCTQCPVKSPHKRKRPEGLSLRPYDRRIYLVAAPYSRVMAFAETTHCLPNLQTSTPFTSLP